MDDGDAECATTHPITGANRAQTRDVRNRKIVRATCFRMRKEHLANETHGLCGFFVVFFAFLGARPLEYSAPEKYFSTPPPFRRVIDLWRECLGGIELFRGVGNSFRNLARRLPSLS